MEITSDQIVDYVGETFAERGERYAEEGRIVSPRREGGRLSAECYGSRERPYEVEVRVADETIESSTCSCPVRGPCKHVAALLFAFERSREQFAEPERLRRQLESMERAEVVDIFMEVAERYREAERYLERRLLERRAEASVESGEVRRHAERAFESAYERASGHGFDEVVAAIVDDLERLAAVGARHRAAGRLEEAMSVWAPIVEVAVEHDFDAGRGLDDLFEFLGELESELIGMLEEFDADDLRRSVFELLWKLFAVDLDHGGVGLARPFWRAVREHATEEEVEELVDRADARRREERRAEWPNRRAGRLLVRFLDEFGGERLDLESELQSYRELDAEADLVASLLRAGRTDQAQQRAAEIEYSREFLEALEAFVDEGLEGRAETLARRRLEGTGHDHAVQAWLVDHLVERDRRDDALEVAMTMLEQHPNRESFDRVALLASALGRWDELRQDAVEILRADAPRAYLQYVIDEDGVDEAAVEIWEREFADQSRDAWRTTELELELAERLEESHPEVATRIWVREIEALLEAGEADDYRRAADLLARVEELLARRGASGRWREIREKFFDRAGAGDGWRSALEEAGLST